MCTTLDFADDVLFATKEIARHEKKPLGQIMSELARQGFAQLAATFLSSTTRLSQTPVEQR